MTGHMLNDMTPWKAQDAKARFSELLDATKKRGPQLITRRGVEEAVVIPIAEWRRLQNNSRPMLKELLLRNSARFEVDVPARGQLKRRAATELK